MSMQCEHFPHELAEAPRDSGNLKQPASINIIKQLGLFVHNGILRCRSRYERAGSLPFDAKYPILLSAKSHLTKLIVLDIHKRYMHCGISHTITVLRQSYWLPSGRKAVRSFLHSCNKCKVTTHTASPYVSPISPALPEFRLERNPPFTYTATDMAGPIYVRSPHVQSKKKTVKCYIAVFTCLVVRCVHLELVSSLKTVSFILALKRFCNTWGCPQLILSDNFSTYHRVDLELEAFLNCKAVKKFALDHNIRWIYSTQGAPWANGCAESMIKVTKGALKRTLGRALCSYEEIATLLSEVQYCVNSRPLLLQGDADLNQHPLTPNDLIRGTPIHNLPPIHTCKADFMVDTDMLDKRLKYLESKANHFWKRFYSEYVSELSTYHYRARGKAGSPRTEPRVGDIVLVKSDTPRTLWKMARITSLHPGRDNQVRRIGIRLVSRLAGPDADRETFRPPQLLCPLEFATNLSIVSPRPKSTLNMCLACSESSQ